MAFKNQKIISQLITGLLEIYVYTTVMLLLQRKWLAGQGTGLFRYMLLGYGVCTLIIIGLLML